MIKIERDSISYSVYFNNVLLEAFSIDNYGEHQAELLAKTFANGWDCAVEAMKCKPELFK